jgi:hypothetical protein
VFRTASAKSSDSSLGPANAQRGTKNRIKLGISASMQYLLLCSEPLSASDTLDSGKDRGDGYTFCDKSQTYQAVMIFFLL